MSDDLFKVGVEIPEKTNINWSGSKAIKHFVIGIDDLGVLKFGGESGAFNGINFLDNVRIYKKDYTDPKASAEDQLGVEAYIKSLKDFSGEYPSGPEPQPLDVQLRDQSWVIIELEEGPGWQFSTSHPAVTTKSSDVIFKDEFGTKKYGFNANLRYVNSDGLGIPFEDVEDGEKYMMVFFRVMYGKKYTGRGMNILVDLFARYENHSGDVGRADGRRRIPIIIDPDVPDDGNQGFPSPP